MSFIIDASEEDVISGKAYNAYMAYLESIRHQLPPSVYDFAIADWHYDAQNPKCPHDSWIQEIKIREIAEGENHEIRKTQVEIIMLGAYHDRLQKITYMDVRSYSLYCSKSRLGHGNWLTDEIGLSDAGLVAHEVKFEQDASLTIECSDLIFQEQLTDTPYSAIWLAK